MIEGEEDRIALDAVHSFFISLGDLSRYKELHLPRESTSSSSNWSTAEEFYMKALALGSGEGKVFNQLAVIGQYRKDVWSSAYYFYASIAASRPFPSRENLSSVFHRVKMLSENDSGGPGSSGSGRGVYRQTFQLYLLHFIGTCFAVGRTFVYVSSTYHIIIRVILQGRFIQKLQPNGWAI